MGGIIVPNYGQQPVDDKIKMLYSHLDDIMTYLYSGVHWHQKAANWSRMLSVRGLGRLHSYMAKTDLCDLQRLEKLCVDKLCFVPQVDMEKSAKSEMWEMRDMNSFKLHFDTWMRREEEYMDCINEAIHISRKVDIQLYNALVCLQERVENEIFRVRLLKDRLALGGWGGADLAYISEKIHHHLEYGVIDEQDIMDINLG